MVNNNWSQRKGEGAQKCKVPQKYKKHIPRICNVNKTKWINTKMQRNYWSQAQGERAQKCKVPQKYRKYVKKVNRVQEIKNLKKEKVKFLKLYNKLKKNYKNFRAC